MLNSFALAAFVVVAVALVVVGLRAARRRGWLPRLGAAIALVLALVSLGGAAVIVRGLTQFYAREAPVPELRVELTTDRVARGKEIATTFCGACHSPFGEMTGGFDVGKDISPRLGAMVTPNLTPAGPVAKWSDGQLFRAIRNGIDADGRWMMIMSYTNVSKLSDEDIHSVIAYIRSLTPAGDATPMPPDQLNPLGAAMLGIGLLPTGNPVNTGVIQAPARGATVEWGQYILSYQDCRACHGQDLHGGVQGQIPPIGPDLVLVSAWSLQDFVKTMRTGIDPDNHQIAEVMPWRTIAKMSDEDLEALFHALTHLPQAPVPVPGSQPTTD